MPLRPRQHEIDTEAIDFIRGKLPSRWTREEVKNDYGNDLFVEIFENGEATALEFRIQSKGHETFEIRHKDQVIQQLEISQLNYYDQLPLPVLLIVYSCKEKQAKYLWIKQYIRNILDKEKPQWRDLQRNSKISISIPLKNVYDETSSIHILEHVKSEISKIRFLSSNNIQGKDRSMLLRKEFSSSPRIIRPRIENFLSRPRLTSVIESLLNQKIVFLRADAGYGKTWLLYDYINTIKPPLFIWYSFTKDLVDCIHFVGELATEFVRLTGNIGNETLHSIQERREGIRPDEAIAVLVNEIISSPTFSILLILEDLHNFDNSDVQLAVNTLLVSYPKNLKIILTSRLPLQNNQARLAAQGHLQTIEQSEIEFTKDEIIEYNKTYLNLDLSQEHVQLLVDRTKGWIAALGLAKSVLEINHITKEKLFDNLSGFKGNIYDFFAEEVYRALPILTRDVLKKISIARSINGEVVNLFTGQVDGEQILRDLSKHNTFIIENLNAVGHFQLHPLFAEFLVTRFQNEEGKKAIQKTHTLLGKHYLLQNDLIFAVEHAIDAEAWQLAICSLEKLGPISTSLGYGFAFIELCELIPEQQLYRSAIICESVGASALQIGDLHLAAQCFLKAINLYSLKNDNSALNRIKYHSAETKLEQGSISPEEFLNTANSIASWSYKHNEFFFGSQVELRLIEVGQTLTNKYGNLFRDLLHRSEKLVEKLLSLGKSFDPIRAKVLASQAHLAMQLVTFGFGQDISVVKMREKIGHPFGLDERIEKAKRAIEGFHMIFALYDEAEKIAKESSDIEWALIHSSHMQDFAHYLCQVSLTGNGPSQKKSTESERVNEINQETMVTILNEIDKCAKIFSKYQLTYALSKSLCDAADIYDVINDQHNRDRLATASQEISNQKGFTDLSLRAEKILRNEDTFSQLVKSTSNVLDDNELANFDENKKLQYINAFLRIFQNDPEIDKIRVAVTSDVEDMIASAKQRTEWCRHIQIIQDLRHTQKIETMYKDIPDKWIICKELGHQSQIPGKSFLEMWYLFKGNYCLGCKNRSL